ncbi:trans-aconitate 2-methyltransferase [Kocuria sp.]|uniref:class I SAM-dependent methyltransferase n=1 Tax=Kocuria sp. TaxID=1871328 RepID=UPI0026DBC6FC|nr:class I SAM-dependent methyltransferase [Kocuria sp.]MDO4918109.1 class I SAM-dependent methyltransferase [Kocuria sp.]
MQPGYDRLAAQYSEAFPDAFRTPLERHAVEAFADQVALSGLTGPVVDVGCGTGHVTAALADRGLPVIGVDPSEAMLEIARAAHPGVTFVNGTADPRTWDAALADGLADAAAGGAPGGEVRPAAVLARYSLIHVTPDRVPGIVRSWAERLPVGGLVLTAFQSVDGGRAVVSFDHAVAPAWRWHPEVMADHVLYAGLTEQWRILSRPDTEHRFPECHVLAAKESEETPAIPVSRGCAPEGC